MLFLGGFYLSYCTIFLIMIDTSKWVRYLLIFYEFLLYIMNFYLLSPHVSMKKLNQCPSNFLRTKVQLMPNDTYTVRMLFLCGNLFFSLHYFPFHIMIDTSKWVRHYLFSLRKM
jgi:hypothetical protein